MAPVSGQRTLLGVSWCMPPALFPRSIQVARLLKGMGRLGWRGLVVTPHQDSRPAADPVDAGLVAAYAGAYDLLPVDLSRTDPESGPRLARWRQRLAGESGLSLDQLWVKRALPIVTRALRNARPDVLVTFAQPWSDHRIGLGVAARSACPWVAHFSDPWVDGPYAADRPAADRAADRADEARVMALADRIVFTNDHAADCVMAKYPPALRAKVRVVPHAMDDELLSSQPPKPVAAASALSMAHVGNLFAGRRRADALFEALVQLRTRQPLAGRLKLQILGEGSGWYEARTRAFELNLDDVVTFHARVPYLESLATMTAADVLVLIDAPADVNLFLPSKIVDYLMAKRPILALTPEVGPSADLMRACGYPIVAPDNVDGIARAVEDLLARHAAGTLGTSPASAAASAPFQLPAASLAFATILNELGHAGAADLHKRAGA